MTTPSSFLPPDDEQRFLAQLTHLVRNLYGEDADIAMAIFRRYDEDGEQCVAVSSMGTVPDADMLMEMFAMAIDGLAGSAKRCKVVLVNREPQAKQ